MNRMHEIVLHEKMRFDCYRFLSACFCEPQKELYREEKLLNNLTLSLRQSSPEAAVFSALMEENLHKYSDEDLAVEYARLFLGPFETKVPPYGSLYLDGEGRVMGDSTMNVVRFYEEAGLSRNEDCHDLPDHVAVELEFMSFLIFKEIEALEKLDFVTAIAMIKKQEHFLEGFLGRWVVPFCEKIKESTDNGFYTALADCTAAFVGSYRHDRIREAISEQVFSASL